MKYSQHTDMEKIKKLKDKLMKEFSSGKGDIDHNSNHI